MQECFACCFNSNPTTIAWPPNSRHVWQGCARGSISTHYERGLVFRAFLAFHPINCHSRPNNCYRRAVQYTTSVKQARFQAKRTSQRWNRVALLLLSQGQFGIVCHDLLNYNVVPAAESSKWKTTRLPASCTLTLDQPVYKSSLFSIRCQIIKPTSLPLPSYYKSTQLSLKQKHPKT